MFDKTGWEGWEVYLCSYTKMHTAPTRMIQTRSAAGGRGGTTGTNGDSMPRHLGTCCSAACVCCCDMLHKQVQLASISLACDHWSQLTVNTCISPLPREPLVKNVSWQSLKEVPSRPINPHKPNPSTASPFDNKEMKEKGDSEDRWIDQPQEECVCGMMSAERCPTQDAVSMSKDRGCQGVRQSTEP